MRIWRYVITHDTGFAPNFAPPMATLATCMPGIRSRARQDDIVLAFNGARLNPDDPNSVRWAGVVYRVLQLEDYWSDPYFQTKRPAQFGGSHSDRSPDNIYRPTPKGGLEQVTNKWHGRADVERDVRGLNALTFRRYWYFGSSVAVLPKDFDLWITGGRRRERLKEIDKGAWHALEKWLDENAPVDVPTYAVESRDRCSPVEKLRPSSTGCGNESV